MALNSQFLWLVVSTPLKNISSQIGQIGNLPQVGVKIKNIWNHHLVLQCNCEEYSICGGQVTPKRIEIQLLHAFKLEGPSLQRLFSSADSADRSRQSTKETKDPWIFGEQKNLDKMKG